MHQGYESSDRKVTDLKAPSKRSDITVEREDTTAVFVLLDTILDRLDAIVGLLTDLNEARPPVQHEKSLTGRLMDEGLSLQVAEQVADILNDMEKRRREIYDA